MQFALTPFLIICSNQQTRQNALGLGETQTSLWTRDNQDDESDQGGEMLV